MKIRIYDNELRIRLLTDELLQLLQQGVLEQSIQFPGGVLSYTLKIANITAISFINNQIITGITIDQAQAMLDSLDAKVQREFSINGAPLSLLIEKDLQKRVNRNH